MVKSSRDCEYLLAEGVPTEVIEKATGLSREELEELKKHLH